MIPQKTRELLKLNWGEKADSLNCYAEVKYIDDLNGWWSCYIFAINPNDEDEMCCLIDDGDLNIYTWTFTDLYSSYNEHGEKVKLDTEFRRKNVAELYKKLKGN